MDVAQIQNPHRRVWRLAGPIIFSNITVPLLGAVDTAVVGHLPDPALIGGVAVGAAIFAFVYWASASCAWAPPVSCRRPSVLVTLRN
jgi:Na+-driven multidrug efflux pump